MRNKVVTKIGAMFLSASMVISQVPLDVMAGPKDSVIEISDSKGLEDMNNDKEGHYRLTQDIKYEPTGKWEEFKMTYFKGTLDGAGHTITLDMDGAQNYVIGTLSGGAEIKNLSVTGTFKKKNPDVGGFVQNMQDATISNCYFDMDVEGYAKVGGIVAKTTGASVIENTCFVGTVQDYDGTGPWTPIPGGIAGEAAKGSVNNCYTTAGRLAGNWENASSVGSNNYQNVTAENAAEILTQLNNGGGRFKMIEGNPYPVPVMGDEETGEPEEAVKSVTVTPESAELEIGETIQLAAEITGATEDTSVTWESSDEEVAEVTNEGLVMAVKAGSADITVTSNADDTKSAVCTITVNEAAEISVTEITLDETELTMDVDETAVLTATVLPEEAANKNVTWSSSAPDVAEVKEGVLTAKKAGEAVITAAAEADENIKATCKVTVKEQVVETVEISTEEALKKMSENPKGSYKLLNDLELSEEWTPFDFSGTFDGDGHVIKGINISSKESSGFFKTLKDGAVVTGLGVEGAVKYTGSTWSDAVAGLAGTLENGTVTDCYAKVDVDGGGKLDYVGFLVGKLPEYANAVIRNCYGTGTINGIREAAGMIGSAERTGMNVTIENCYTYREGTVVKLIGKRGRTDSVSSYKNNYATQYDDPLTKQITDKMTMEELLAGLNKDYDAYMADEQSINNHYPVLKWQKQEVTEISVEEIQLDKEEVSMEVGEEAVLRATVLPEEAANKNVTWSSSNSDVVDVKDGVLTAKKAGEAVITAAAKADENVKATCKVTVKEKPAEIVEITLEPKEMTLQEGASAPLNAVTIPQGKTVTFTSMNKKVAEVLPHGLVVAQGAGETDIWATVAGTETAAKCHVTVLGAPKKLKNQEDLANMREDGNYVLENDIYLSGWTEAVNITFRGILDGNGHTIYGLNTSGRSSASGIGGLVSSLGNGAVIKNLGIVGRVENVNGDVGGLAGQAVVGANIVISNCFADIEALAVGGPNGSGMKGAASAFVGLCSDKSSVTFENCYAVGSVAGSTDYKYGGLGGLVGRINIGGNAALKNCYTTVGKLVGVQTKPDSGVLTLENCYTPENGDGTVIPEDMDDFLNKLGKAYKADSDNFNNGYPVLNWQTFKKIFVTGVTLEPDTLRLKVGEKAPLQVTVLPENATEKGVSWMVSNPPGKTVATVIDNVVTGVNPGEVTIKATTKDGGKTASCKVTVSALDIVYAEKITLNKEKAELEIGDELELTAEVTPENAADKTVVWSSEDEKTAVVDETGKVTAKAAGTTVITAATKDGTVKASCEITVKEPIVAVEKITLNKEKAELEIGDELELTAEVTPENATDKTVVWSSEDEKTAVVDENGKVTAKAAGTTVITAATKDGTVKAGCEITVKEAEKPDPDEKPDPGEKPNPDEKPDPGEKPNPDEKPEPDNGVSSLTNKQYGAVLRGEELTSDMELVVTPLDKNSSVVELMRKAIPSSKSVFRLFDIRLLKDGKEIPLPQKSKLYIPVGEKYNGKELTVLHYVDGKLEELKGKVSEGSVVVEVSSLSPFGVVVDTAANGNGNGSSGNGSSGNGSSGNGSSDKIYSDKGSDTVKTGDETSLMLWFLLAAGAFGSIVLCTGKRRRR